MRAETHSAAAPYRLLFPRSTLHGRLGDRLGKGTGSSLEFMDYREYMPGDDLRHVDWRAFARTDKLSVRLYREEIRPFVEILVDLSASMFLFEDKRTALQDLVDALAAWAVRAGADPRLYEAGALALTDKTLAPGTKAPLSLIPQARLRRSAFVILISDFLFEHDASAELSRLSAGRPGLTVLQLLGARDVEPSASGPTTVIDSERGTRRDLHLDKRAMKGYGERLDRLCEAIATTCRATGASYARVVADSPEKMFREALLPAGLIEPGP